MNNISYSATRDVNRYKSDILGVTQKSAPNLYDGVEGDLENFNQRSILIVASQQDKLIGFATIRKIRLSSLGGDGYNHHNYRINDIVVDKDYQHKGVGQALFNTAISYLIGMKASSVDLIYEKKDDQDGRLTRFYTKLGETNQGISNFRSEKYTISTNMEYFLKSSL